MKKLISALLLATLIFTGCADTANSTEPTPSPDNNKPVYENPNTTDPTSKPAENKPVYETFVFDETVIAKTAPREKYSKDETVVRHYDGAGRVVKEEIFEDGTELEEVLLYVYGENGNITVRKNEDPYDIEQDVTFIIYSDGGLREDFYEYEYNSRTGVYRVDDFGYAEYVKEGQLGVMAEYDSNGREELKVIYEYNTDGSVKKITTYKDGRLITK